MHLVQHTPWKTFCSGYTFRDYVKVEYIHSFIIAVAVALSKQYKRDNTTASAFCYCWSDHHQKHQRSVDSKKHPENCQALKKNPLEHMGEFFCEVNMFTAWFKYSPGLWS